MDVIRGAHARDLAEIWGKWGGFVVSTSRIHRPGDVEGLVLEEVEGEVAALVTWRAEGESAEIVTLDAFPPGRGSGSRVLEAAEAELASRGVRRIWLLTTNDNVRALAFYQRHGYRLVRVYLDFMDLVRRSKPHLPLKAENGLLREDAWELRKDLPGAVRIREELPSDAAWIREVVAAAFPTPAEADLVDALRGSPDSVASVVAVEGGRVVGHVLYSRARLRDVPVAGLAPVAVREDRRRRGIGSRLIRAGLEICRRRGERVAVVLGDPAYYRRFGFRTAAGIGCEYDAPAGHFQVLALSEGALQGLSGIVRYADPFRRFQV